MTDSRKAPSETWAKIIDNLGILRLPDGSLLMDNTEYLREATFRAIGTLVDHTPCCPECASLPSGNLLKAVAAICVKQGVITDKEYAGSPPGMVDLSRPMFAELVKKHGVDLNFVGGVPGLLGDLEAVGFLTYAGTPAERTAYWRKVSSVYFADLPDGDEVYAEESTRPEDLVDLMWFHLRCVDDPSFAGRVLIDMESVLGRLAALVSYAIVLGIVSAPTHPPLGLNLSGEENAAAERALSFSRKRELSKAPMAYA